MIALRILNLVVWSVLLSYMAPGAIAAVTRHARYGDPMRLACSLTAIIFIAFNLFWAVGAGAHVRAVANDTLLNALLVLSAALGAYIFKLGRTYGRGSLLSDRKADE